MLRLPEEREVEEEAQIREVMLHTAPAHWFASGVSSSPHEFHCAPMPAFGENAPNFLECRKRTGLLQTVDSVAAFQMGVLREVQVLIGLWPHLARVLRRV